MSSCPIVETKAGKVQGRQCSKPKQQNAKVVYRYSSIPFAKPPLGELRFEPPENPDSWSHVLDCTKMAKSPMQSEEMSKPFDYLMPFSDEFGEEWRDMSEDCLYLNVYTSKPKSSAKMPVLFWIYGGAFTMGASACYDGKVLASLHDVVVVIPNYRVNFLGYLSFPGPDTPCPGNVGMLDQVKALEWVRDNISKFGGDPKNVTIFGESAGSISCSLHLVSPLSKGLFHRAISHSGTSDIEMMVKKDNQIPINALLSDLNITEKDPKKIVKILKSLPVEDMLKAQYKSVEKMVLITPITKDGKFLPVEPATVLKEGKFAKVPYIIGINSTECMGLSAPGLDKNFKTGLNEKDAKEILNPVLSMMVAPEKVEAVMKALIEVYEKDFNRSEKVFWSKLVSTVFADMWFVLGTKKMASIHSGSAPTFFYIMSQSLRLHHDRDFNHEKKSELKADFCECDHGDDINFTFGLPLNDSKLTFDAKFSKEEKKFSEDWMKLIVNFATSGNPNKGPNKAPVKWTPYNPTEDNYLNANDKMKMEKKFATQRVRFWNEEFPKLMV